MAVTSPGDCLPCSIPQAMAEKLQSIGATRNGAGAASDPLDAAASARPDPRTLPPAPDSAPGRRIDLAV